jgi:chromosome segregation ATPase
VASSQEDLSALQLDMDRMSQEAWRLSSALSATRQDNAALQSALAVAEDQLAALQAQAGEHSQLALAYDKLCQDFYKLRMSLQASQEQRGDAAEDAAGELAALRADMTWLQKDHRTSLAAAHQEQELLAAEVRRLRLSLLESQQALWAAGAAVPASHTGSSSSSSSSSSVTGGSSGSSSSSNRTSQQKDGQSGPATTALSSPSASTSAPAEDTAGQQATPGAGSGLTPLAATATSEEPSSALQEQQQVPSAEVEALQLQLQQALASAEEERAALAGEVQALSRQAALRELELASLRAQVAAAQQQQEQAPRAATGVEQGGELGLMDADLVGRLQSALEERGSLQEQLAAAQAQVGTLQQQLSAASASLAAPAATSVAAGLVGLEGKQVLAQARVEAGEAR